MFKNRPTYVVNRKPYVAYRLPFVALPFLLSCSSGSSYMPSDTGTVWTYKIRTGFGAQHVADVSITKRISVTGTEGFEVAGPLGASRLAWKNGALWAQTFANAQVQPAIPLLRLDRQSAQWKGALETTSGKERAAGRLSHGSEQHKLGGRDFEAVRTELVLTRPRSSTTLTTWFIEGIGIVKQEQRTNGELDLRLEWVSGPRRTDTE